MSDTPLTLEFLGRQLGNIQTELQQMRIDVGTLMTRVVAQSDWNRQFEQRLVDQTGTLVAEFKGRIGISQSIVERRMDDLSERIEELETGKSRFSP